MRKSKTAKGTSKVKTTREPQMSASQRAPEWRGNVKWTE